MKVFGNHDPKPCGGAQVVPRFTVVTVTFNAASELERTLASVAAQTYDHLEYVVVDGGSTDGTLTMLDKWSTSIDRWVSEPDGGIYDAMNKGALLSSGTHIIFLNAGDRFLNDKSVQRLAEAIASSSAGLDAFYYTDHYVLYRTGITRWARSNSPTQLWMGMIACHQAVAHPAAAFRSLAFDCGLRYAADYKFLQSAADLGFPLIRLGEAEPLVLFEAGGLSDIRRTDVIREYERVKGAWRWHQRVLRRVYLRWCFAVELVKPPIKRGMQRLGFDYTRMLPMLSRRTGNRRN
jgi:putative colanic acid biosynthesis glycosyltransferase